MLDDIKEAFSEQKPVSENTTTEVGHGRIEKRTCRVIEDTAWICKKEEWKGLCSLIEITSERTTKATGEKQAEVRYYISSLSADASAFNRYIRSHWGIENSSCTGRSTLFFTRTRAKKEPAMPRKTLPSLPA